jgi:hypothetical protein
MDIDVIVKIAPNYIEIIIKIIKKNMEILIKIKEKFTIKIKIIMLKRKENTIYQKRRIY